MKNILLTSFLFGIVLVSSCGPEAEKTIYTSETAFRADSLKKDSVQKAEAQAKKENLLKISNYNGEFVKMFKTDYTGSLSLLESSVNDWLVDQKDSVEVIRVTQSGDKPEHTTLTIFYKRKR